MTNLDTRLKQLVDESVAYGVEISDDVPTKESMADTDNYIGETVQEIYKAFIDAGWRKVPPGPTSKYYIPANGANDAKKV